MEYVLVAFCVLAGVAINVAQAKVERTAARIKVYRQGEV